MEKEKTITLLLLAVIILSLVVAYTFLLKPYLDDRDLSNKRIGYEYAFNDILVVLQQKGYVPLVYGNETIYLVTAEPQETTQ